MVIHATDSNFKEEVLNSDKPVLVDFWATWCGPCKMLAPTIDNIASKYDGQLKVVKVDVDQNPMSANMFGIQSIPTLILFNEGKALGKIIGFRPENQIEDAIKGALNI
ncbi:MAG: thioredoxin [Caloramator sp.]|nr:thioredoxin [Caloramator sp.]